MAFTTAVMLVLGVAAVAKTSSTRQTVSVNTTIGVINGKVENITFFDKSSTLLKFLGIPFAEPPTGDLRFKKPVRKTPLTVPLDAFVHSSACLQGHQRQSISYSEDCLYLNIYAPETDDKNAKLAVMVYVYGGGFNLGDSNMFAGDRLSIHGNVIVVTLNYRVSIFGFLSTGDIESPGNYGLWDQQLAIKWIHDNIAAFGGDPDRVTIFGQSAGSGSVVYQGLYSKNKGLFKRVIAESGSTMAWWGSTDKGLQYAKEVGSIAKCDTATSHALVACLRSIPAEKLTNLILDPAYDITIYAFRPVIDNDFIDFDPKQLFQLDTMQLHSAIKSFAEIDFMTGVNAGEGVGGLQKMYGVADMDFMPNRTDFENRLVPILIKEEYGDNTPAVLNKLMINRYTNWSDPDSSDNIRDEYMQMHADNSFNAQIYMTLDTHSDAASTSKTYMYYLDVEPVTHFAGNIPWFKKAMHGEELPFVFGYGISYKSTMLSPEDWEINLSNKVMSLWTNFAKTGNPNSPDDIGIGWKPYTKQDQYYLQIARNLTSSNVKQRWNVGAPYFWYKVIPSIVALGTCD